MSPDEKKINGKLGKDSGARRRVAEAAASPRLMGGSAPEITNYQEDG